MKLKSLLKKKNNKGVFGLTAVQQFFVIILGIALLAYVIVIIMGTLSETNILNSATGSFTNETITPTDSGVALSANSNPNCQATITTIVNGTASTINTANYSVSACTLTNLTSEYTDGAWNVTYTFTYDSASQVNTKEILANTSTGVSGFFESINPVYAILAVLVIILVLVVLVRVVQAPSGTRTSPQL